MRNGSSKHRAPSAGAHKRPHLRGLDIVTKRTSEVRKRIGVWSSAVAQQTKEHPVRSAAMAIGAGYLLGGGLFSGLTARILGTGMRVGLRMVLVPFMTQSIVALGENIFTRGTDANGDDSSSTDADTDSKTMSNQRHSAQKET
jgi:hypothetical protein